MKYRFLIAAVALAALAGCATKQTMYNWGSYEQSMYEHYKNPSDLVKVSAALNETIANSEKSNRAVPPGLYAEYGYLLMQQNRMDEAQAYFAKEKAKWPESSALMDHMMKLAQAKPASKEGSKQ
jgi:hypothetical protein